jgi:ketosteroid isomerase-like protein
MASQEVIASLREGYEALNRGDLTAVLDLIDPELRWEEGGRSPEAGNYSGRDSFERYVQSWLDSFEDFRIEIEEIREEGDRLTVVARQSGRGRASGLPIETRIVHAWTVHGDRAVGFQSEGA